MATTTDTLHTHIRSALTRVQDRLGRRLGRTKPLAFEPMPAGRDDVLQQLVEALPFALWVQDQADGALRYVSPAAQAMAGVRMIAGDDYSALFRRIHMEDRERLFAELRKTPAGRLDHECRLVGADGAVRWMRVRTFAIAATPSRIAGSMEDVTDRKEATDRLLQLAHYDLLTGLPNRLLLHESLKTALARAEEHHWTVSVLFIDIDHFKSVNDTLGHAVGDELLRQVAHRLLRCLRIRDAVGRLGGDEFVLILVATQERHAAAAVATKIRRTLRRPFDIDGQKVSVTASVGIAVGATDSRDAETLIEYADAAMYQAKESGRDTQCFHAVEPAGSA
jgi:diguanylate cyclase (GGDEF)-like protein/PAS domain S-box-containing protein